MAVFLFLGADEYLLAQRLAQIRRGLGDPELADLNSSELAGEKSNAAEILAQASMMPFLCERRLLLVRGFLGHLDKRLAANRDLAAHKDASKDSIPPAYGEAARFLEGLLHLPDSCDLVLIEQELDKRRALWKGFSLPAKERAAERKVAGVEALIKNKTIQQEELNTPDARSLSGWIQQQAKTKQISIEMRAVQMLAEFVGSDLRRLNNELEKLALYANGNAITAETVKTMVSDASEALIWDLTDALGQRNGRNAMRTLYELRSGTNASSSGNPFYLLTMIARQYRTIIKVKEAMHAGDGDEYAIAKTVGESPYPVKKAMQQAQHYSFAELDAILERLLAADFAMKTGADQETTIDVLIAELTQKLPTILCSV